MPDTRMKTSAVGRALIRQFEGCRLEAYRCPAGIPTIGVGHIRGVKMGDRCTPQQADVWLTQDLEDAEAAVSTLVKVPLTQGQFDALVSFVFNLGIGAFKKSALLTMLNDGRPYAAAAQFKLWGHAGGKELPGLVKRRAAEVELFMSHEKVPA